MEPPVYPVYRDRRGGLIFFGIVEILIGLLCMVMILIFLLGQLMASGRPNMPHGQHSVITVVSLYGFMAVASIWLGAGSIEARRWARAIILSLSSVLLVFGAVACVFMAFFLPRLMDIVSQDARTPLPPAGLLFAKISIVVSMVLFLIIIPGSMFLFYRSPHVRRTCEVRDPVERWTDRCPVPVLALSLSMGIGGVMFLSAIARVHVVAVFGTFVGGPAGLALSVLMCGLYLYVAYGFYRLDVRAWWIALVAKLIYLASSAVTFWLGGFSGLYSKMNIDPRAAAMSSKLLDFPAFKWMVILSFIPWLVWLLCIRRYFGKPYPPPVLPANSLLPPA